MLVESIQKNQGMTPALAALPVRLVESTVRAATQAVASSVVPVAVARLVEGGLKAVFLNRLSTAAAALIILAALTTGATGWAWQAKGRPAVLEARAENSPRAKPAIWAPEPQAPTRAGNFTNLVGRVVDDQGRLVPGAQVRLRLFRRSFQPVMSTSELVDIWQARTDAQGRYRVEGFRWAQGPGSVYLQADVNAPDFVEFFTFSMWKPARADNADASLPEVQLKRGTNVTGRCLGPDGKAVSGAKIEKIFAGFAASSRGRMPTTDAEGRFRLTIPAAGAAELIIYSDRWAPRRVSVPSLGGNLGDIHLEAGVELIGHLRDSWSDPLTGRGRAEGLTAKAFIPGGRPLADKLIALQSTDGGQVNYVPIELACRTDREGNFRVHALKGPYKIWVARDAESGPDECVPLHSPGSAPAVLPRVLDFNPDSQGANPRLELTLLTRPEVAIRGTVTSWDRKPAQGVAMILQAAIGDEMNNTLTNLAWAYTDAQGRYSLTGISRELKQSYLLLLPHAPPNKQSFRAVPSGHFQPKAGYQSPQGVNFQPLTEDQNPLDFQLELLEP